MIHTAKQLKDKCSALYSFRYSTHHCRSYGSAGLYLRNFCRHVAYNNCCRSESTHSYRNDKRQLWHPSSGRRVYQRTEAAEEKTDTFSGVYWCLTTAIYLGWSFWSREWDFTWIIWPVAGVLFAALLGIVKMIIGKKEWNALECAFVGQLIHWQTSPLLK